MLVIIKDTIEYAIEYAYRHKMRLLIEIEPDYRRIFVYCDDFNVGDFAEIFRNLDNIKVVYKTTDLFYKYENYPKYVILEFNKGKWQYRFYKKYEVDLVETKDRDYYFIERSLKFQQAEKDILIDNVGNIDFKVLSLEEIEGGIEKILDDFDLNIEFNIFNDFGVIFYK